MEDEQFERLVGCFKKVFPGMNRSDIPSAVQESITAWDSIAQVTLVSLIGEEFAVDIDFDDFDEATSFASILDLVRAKMSNSRP